MLPLLDLDLRSFPNIFGMYVDTIDLGKPGCSLIYRLCNNTSAFVDIVKINIKEKKNAFVICYVKRVILVKISVIEYRSITNDFDLKCQ